MFSINTDVTIKPISSFFNSITSNYVNSSRDINDVYSLSSIDGIDLQVLNYSDNLKNVLVEDDYTLFLSEYTPLTSIFSTKQTIDSYNYGFETSQFVCDYSTLSSEFVQTSPAFINNQYITVLDNNINFIPLRTFDSLGYTNSLEVKDYQKIYKKNKPFIQYKIHKIPIYLNPDSVNILYNSYNISSAPISSNEFINDGSIGGSCPLNSDMILFDSSSYGIYSDIGYDNINNISNGTLLGLWLSSQTYEPSSAKIWMERWYDPNTTDESVASHLHSVDADFKYIVDIPSNKILSPKERFDYVRHGPVRNNVYIESLESNIICLTSWQPTFSQNSTSGYLVNYSGNSAVFDMDGSSFGVILPNEDILIKDSLSFATWINLPTIQDTQIFGNYYNGYGYGLSLNLGDSLDSITIPTISGDCFSINYRGYKIFEKDILGDLGLSSVYIKYVNIDLDGNTWLYDDLNKKMFRLENDNMISYFINLPSTSVIEKMEYFSDNSFALLNTENNTISSFSSIGSYLSSYSIPSYNSTFDIKSDNTIHHTAAEFFIFDNYDRAIKIIGSTVYVDDVRILHLIDKPSSIAIDIDNNLWVIVDKNLLKVDIYGNILLDVQLNIDVKNTQSTEMSFVTDNSGDFNLWIVFNSSATIIVVNSVGRIIKRIPLNNIGNRNCSTYTFNVHGYFSNFNVVRKFNKLNETVISKKYPALTLKMSLTCGDNDSIQIIHTKAPDINKWNHIAFTLGHVAGNTVITIFINGKIANTKIIEGLYTIKYNTPSSPFIIGDYTGKLGPRNLEKSISKSNFLHGVLDNFNIYHTCLTEFDVQALARQKYKNWDGIYLHVEIPPTTFIESIDKININRYKGYKTNKYDIVITNFSDDPNIRDYVSNYIRDNIGKISPVNTTLNSIIFE